MQNGVQFPNFRNLKSIVMSHVTAKDLFISYSLKSKITIENF